MVTLADSIRMKITAQFIHDPPHYTGKQAMLEMMRRAWWIAGKYGFRARMPKINAPQRFFNQKSIIRIIINDTYRYTTIPIFQILQLYRKEDPIDIELIELIREIGSGKSSDIARGLGIETRKVASRLRKEQKRNSIILHQKLYWYWEEFQDKFPCEVNEVNILELTEEEVHQYLIKQSLLKYPFLSLDQVSFLTQIDSHSTIRILSRMSRENIIQRGLTRDDVPDEFFSIKGINDDINWDETPIFVLEKRDVLVELITLERYFTHKEGNYWIFLKGLPQAEFDMKKRGGKYLLANYRRLPTSTEPQQTIIASISEWAIREGIDLTIDVVDNLFRSAKKFIDILVSRGYYFKDDSLTLQKTQHGNTSSNFRKLNRRYSWHTLRQWYRKKQFLTEGNYSIETILLNLIQLDEIESLAIRMRQNPNRLDIDSVLHISGINYRFGFVHADNLQDIILAYPKVGEMKYQERRIFDLLVAPLQVEKLAEKLHSLTATLRVQLSVMEKKRLVRRRYSLQHNREVWMRFNYELPNLRETKQSSESSLGELMCKVLEHHIPLTLLQLSKILGFPQKKLDLVKNEFLRKGKLIEGYYLDEEQEIQITTPKVLDEISLLEDSDDEEPSVNSVDIIPFSDPVALVFLNTMIELYPSLQPSKRYDRNSEWWMILWKGEPAGYLVKSPNVQALVDFRISIRLHKRMCTNPVIAGILQRIISVFKDWYDDELHITDINNLPLYSEKYEGIHFLAGTLGLL